MPPTLKTERLTLRPLELRDFPAYADFWLDPRVVQFITGAPVAREQSWRRLLAMTGHWQLLGFGFFAIVESNGGRFVGEAGFQEMRRELVPSIEGTLETGWGILPACQRQGYASEAMTAAMAWAQQVHPGRDFSCIISPENRPSLRLASKFDFALDTATEYQGKPVQILRRPAGPQS